MTDLRRHIQNFSDAAELEPHWGYADRVVPCTNDAGSCEYLDLVYSAHDRGMIYVGAMWAIIIFITLAMAVHRQLPSSTTGLVAAAKVALRHYLLPDLRPFRWLFGRISRVQIVVLAILTGYLTVFTFVGLTYQQWITPVKDMPGVYNTRTTLGPWSDRVGVLAYALTPLSILLAQRESLLSLLTGIAYHHFNFLHRWVGHIILAQSVLHTIGWCIVEIRLYQPQPTVAITWIKQQYMIWGVVAMLLLILLWGLSTSYARRAFGYEFFRKAHYILAMLFIGACYAHWENLACFMIPSLLLWGLDRGLRLVRTALIHHRGSAGNDKGMFASIPAKATYLPGEIVRLDLHFPSGQPGPGWKIGQHYYLTFPDSRWGIWQSHPFTPLNLPSTVTQSYVFRGKKGETKRIANRDVNEVGVILSGPYGGDVTADLQPGGHVLCVAGGTGITFVLPVMLGLAGGSAGAWKGKVKLVWVIQHSEDAEWIKAELDVLRAAKDKVEVEVFVTREGSRVHHLALDKAAGSDGGEGEGSGASTPGEEKEKEKDLPSSDSSTAEAGFAPSRSRHPDLPAIIRAFVEGEREATTVYVSGPVGMISEVRDEVARCNKPRKAWKGEGGDVRLVFDERLE